MFAESRIGDISHPPLSSCGRVIGEPWKSKILMKGLPYTYRTWSREMRVLIRWIRNHSQNQFLVKNSDPPSNLDTRGRRNSQNKRCFNGTKDIKKWSPPSTVSQSSSAVWHVPKYIHVLSFKKSGIIFLWQRIYELLSDEKICILQRNRESRIAKSGFPKKCQNLKCSKNHF